MPAKNHLSQSQRERLVKLLKESDSPYIREKVLIILLINDGKTYHEISEFLEIGYTKVAYWAVHGDPDNLDSFSDERSQGNFRKITPEYENLLLEIIEKSPDEYGYDFGQWTAYNPDYNLIELVWHSAKEYIAHRLFESVEQLEKLLHQLLNEGGLEIKWERKIKNKGNAVCSVKLRSSLTLNSVCPRLHPTNITYE